MGSDRGQAAREGATDNGHGSAPPSSSGRTGTVSPACLRGGWTSPGRTMESVRTRESPRRAVLVPVSASRQRPRRSGGDGGRTARLCASRACDRRGSPAIRSAHPGSAVKNRRTYKGVRSSVTVGPGPVHPVLCDRCTPRRALLIAQRSAMSNFIHSLDGILPRHGEPASPAPPESVPATIRTSVAVQPVSGGPRRARAAPGERGHSFAPDSATFDAEGLSTCRDRDGIGTYIRATERSPTREDRSGEEPPVRYSTTGGRPAGRSPFGHRVEVESGL